MKVYEVTFGPREHRAIAIHLGPAEQLATLLAFRGHSGVNVKEISGDCWQGARFMRAIYVSWSKGSPSVLLCLVHEDSGEFEIAEAIRLAHKGAHIDIKRFENVQGIPVGDLDLGH